MTLMKRLVQYVSPPSPAALEALNLYLGYILPLHSQSPNNVLRMGIGTSWYCTVNAFAKRLWKALRGLCQHARIPMTWHMLVVEQKTLICIDLFQA